jgi:hypothetical protein
LCRGAVVDWAMPRVRDYSSWIHHQWLKAFSCRSGWRAGFVSLAITRIKRRQTEGRGKREVDGTLMSNDFFRGGRKGDFLFLLPIVSGALFYFLLLSRSDERLTHIYRIGWTLVGTRLFTFASCLWPFFCFHSIRSEEDRLWINQGEIRSNVFRPIVATVGHRSLMFYGIDMANAMAG